MIDILIMSYPKVDYGPKKQSYKAATIFHGVPLICLLKTPKKYFSHLEFEIEDILEHEILHLVLDDVEPEASNKLDNIIPYTHSLIELKNRGRW